MSILSSISYFFSQHALLAMPVIVILFGLLGGAIGHWKKQPLWGLLFLAGFPIGGINVFTSHFVNALFLNAVGATGSAVIVHSDETSSTLNDRNIWEYDVVLRTADGRDVATKIDTMSVSIYPIRNEIVIPPEGQAFVIKYVPGFARNFVIMSDQSEYGKERLIQQDQQPVEKAAAQLAVSPGNPVFIEEYRSALKTFLNAHRGDADPDLIHGYEQKLDSLGSSSK
jgi:hypothetical protein